MALMAFFIDLIFYVAWLLARGKMGAGDLGKLIYLYACLASFCAYFSYSLERSFRRDFLLQKEFQQELARTQSILNNMLPAHINKQLANLKRARQLKLEKGIVEDPVRTSHKLASFIASFLTFF